MDLKIPESALQIVQYLVLQYLNRTESSLTNDDFLRYKFEEALQSTQFACSVVLVPTRVHVPGNGAGTNVLAAVYIPLFTTYM